MIFRILLRRKYWENHVSLGSYFNAIWGMGILVAEIQTNLYIWTCCNQIQPYSPFIIYAMWPIFNKVAEICVASLDDRLVFFCVFTVIFTKWSQIFYRYLEHFGDIWEKIFEIFREKNRQFPETYLGDVSWYLYLGLVCHLFTFVDYF